MCNKESEKEVDKSVGSMRIDHVTSINPGTRVVRTKRGRFHIGNSGSVEQKRNSMNKHTSENTLTM